MNTTSKISHLTLHQKHPNFSLTRISAAILLSLTLAPDALANCTPDGSGLYITCSGAASDNVFLDTLGNPGSVAVTVESDFTSNKSLYISNNWSWPGTPGSSEPMMDNSGNYLPHAAGLSVLLESGNTLTQILSPSDAKFRRVLYIEAATDNLSVVLERDVEQILNNNSTSNAHGYLHAIEIRNMQGYTGAIFDLYSSTENSITMTGNIEQSVNIPDNFSVTAHEVANGHGGFIGFNAEIAGIKNHIRLSGDVTQSVTAEAIVGSQSGSPGDIAAIRIFSNTWQNENGNHSADFAPLATLEKAENYIDISGNIKQNFTTPNMYAYVQSGSNFINNALYVNTAGVNNTVLMSGDVERMVSAETVHETVGSGVNIQSNLYYGLNTGAFSQTMVPDPALFLNDITNHIEISGSIKQTVVADTIGADTSASAGRQGFSTASVQVMGSHNTITLSGDVTKDIQATSDIQMSGDAAILVQANASSLGYGYAPEFTPEIWDMIGRTENTITLSGNVIHRMTGGLQHNGSMYQNINFSSVDVSALGVNNIATVSGNIERAFSGDSGVVGSAALDISLNLLNMKNSGGASFLYAPSEDTLARTQNIINLSGDVTQSISYTDLGFGFYPSGYELSNELFASDIATAGRQSNVLISGNINSSVSIPLSINPSWDSHAGGIRLRNYYGDMNALITGDITVTDANDVADSLLDTVPPSLCLTAMFDDLGCPGGPNDNIKNASVGLRATNYGDSLNLAIEGDILSTGIGIQVRPFADSHTVTLEDGSTLSKGQGDLIVDIAARVQGLGGYAFEASRITEDKLTLGLRDNWVLQGAAYAAYSNPDNRLMLHGDTDSSLDLSRLSSVGEWEWVDGSGNFTGYVLSGDTIANFHHLEKEGDSTWYLTGTQTDGGFRDGIIRSGALILDNASLLMEKTSKDSLGNIDPSLTHSGLLTIASDGVMGAQGTSFVRGGDVANAGLINLNTNFSTSNQLTIDGNLHSNGGVIAFGTVLGDDSSATDRLTITGNASGYGKVSVTNVGGYGAETLQGIELIHIQGDSDATFTKASRIVAGAYDYDLLKKGKNWYLVNMPASSIRPEAGAYQANQVAANGLFMMSLHDRGGERQRKDPTTGQEMKGMWMRQEFGRMSFGDSYIGLTSETNRALTQIGIDLIESGNEQNRLVGGLMAGYGHTSSKTRSGSTGYSARGNTDGWSAGIYGTWFEDDKTKEGAYADSWLLYSRFKNSIRGNELATEKYWSDNITASLELGYTFKLNQREYSQQHRRSAYIQPQAQVVQTWGNNINHKEYNGTQINSDGDNTLTRLGFRVFTKERWTDSKGHFREFEPYGELNWQSSNTTNFVKMNEVTVKNTGMKNSLEMRLGIRGQLTDNLSLWTDVSMKSGQQEYRDRMGQIGLKYHF